VNLQVTAIVQRECDLWVAQCPEFDLASQGDCVEQARANLAEAVQLLLECAPADEIARRGHAEAHVTRVEIRAGLLEGSCPVPQHVRSLLRCEFETD
jgi:predicted RNase H-like HicB family nuclease